MKYKTVDFVLLIILFTACSTGQVETVAPFPTLSETSSSTAVIAGLTRTLSPTKTPSRTMQPTQTIPAATLSAIGTTEAIRAKLISQIPELEEYIAFCHPNYCYGIEVSPDGQWAYFSNENGLEIFNINGKQVGKYSFREISGRPDVVEGGLSGVHWSKDGRYLYLATSFGDGGPGPYFGYKYSIARVNLQNGTWKDTGISGVLSFSPNDKYIIYSTNMSEIRVRNLQNGEEKIYRTPDYYQSFGEFVWSLDSKKIIFVATPEDFVDANNKFALFMIDLESDTITNLYEDSMPFYYPVEWVEDNKVTLNKYQEDGTWTLDLSVDPPTINP